MNKGVAAGYDSRHGLGVLLIGQRDHAIFGWHPGPGADQHQMIGRAQALHRVDQDADVLLLGGTAREAQQASVGAQPQPLQQPVAIATVGVEGVHLDAKRPNHDAAHPRLFQPLGDEAAGRDHPVELGEQLGPALLHRLLGPFAEMQRRQTRRVRVTEADDRATDPLAGLQRALARRIGVARLDQRRIERGAPRPPAPHRTGPAITVAEGQFGRVQTHHAVQAGLMRGAGHHQIVRHAGPVGLQPGLLGQQIAFHPARARREQHGGVDQARAGIGARRLHGPQGVGHLFVQPRKKPQLALLDVDMAGAHAVDLLPVVLHANAKAPTLDAAGAVVHRHGFRP
ncbi:hypothetical protein D3C80_1111130 [compost metagenome]